MRNLSSSEIVSKQSTMFENKLITYTFFFIRTSKISFRLNLLIFWSFYNVLILFLFSIKTSYPLMVKNTPNGIIIVYCYLKLTFISVLVKDICLWFLRNLTLYTKNIELILSTSILFSRSTKWHTLIKHLST